MEDKKTPYPPGSKKAIEAGCRCPVVDNRHGLGVYISSKGRQLFSYNSDCPYHFPKLNPKREDNE